MYFLPFFLATTILLVRLNSLIWTLISFELININMLLYLNSMMSLPWFIFLLTLQVSESLLLLSLLIIYFRLI